MKKPSLGFQFRWTIIITSLIALLSTAQNSSSSDPAFATRVERILTETPLIDGHNDLPEQIQERWKGSLTAFDLLSNTSKILAADGTPLMTDIPRLRASRLGGQFWSVWVPTELKGTCGRFIARTRSLR
jgi:membrane dipeptidase